MSTNTTKHPSDALLDLRVQMLGLQARERMLCEAIAADRELRVGEESYAVVSERRTADGGIEEVVSSHMLPPLEEVLGFLKSPLLIIDTETTGLYPARGDRVLSLGMLRAHYGWSTAIGVLHGSIRQEQRLHAWDEYLQHFNPEGRQSSPEAARVHGITEEYLAKKWPFREYEREVYDILNPDEDEEMPIICGHNITFDIDFLNAEFERCGRGQIRNVYVDTRITSKMLWPDQSGSLDALCERLGVDRGNRDQHHDALDDCHLVAKCIPGLVAEIEKRLAND